MATAIYVDPAKKEGRDTLNALRQINAGVAQLFALDGKRAQAIGAGQPTMRHVFGTDTDASAQALSDRMAAFMAHWNAQPVLTDLIDATFEGHPPA